jgi:hypothetical protein
VVQAAAAATSGTHARHLVQPEDSAPPAPATPPATPVSSPVLQPLAPGRYKVQFTASAALRDKLERLQALMRLQVPDGDLGAVIEAAVTEKLERIEKRRFGTTTHPRTTLSNTDTTPRSRYIPAAVRRAVRERDGNQCRYVDASGRRCEERRRLQYHHVETFGTGGDHRPENIRLMCSMHNNYLAECDYGRDFMNRSRGSRRRTGSDRVKAGAVTGVQRVVDPAGDS